MTDEQPDLFSKLPSLVNQSNMREDRDMMWQPFLVPAKSQKKPHHFSNPETGLEITLTGADYGIANIWDGDKLIYFRTGLIKQINEGNEVTRTFSYRIYDYLKATGEPTGKDNYARHVHSLYRLKHTGIRSRYKGVTPEGDKLTVEGVTSWADDIGFIKRETARGVITEGVEITLSRWCFNMMEDPSRAIAIPKAYFQISGGLSRKIFQIVHKGMGDIPVFFIGLEKLHLYMGMSGDLPKFLFALRKIVEADDLPFYTLSITDVRPLEFRPDGAMSAREGRGKPLYLEARRRDVPLLT